MEGQNSKGKIGLFPESYVTVVPVRWGASVKVGSITSPMRRKFGITRCKLGLMLSVLFCPKVPVRLRRFTVCTFLRRAHAQPAAARKYRISFSYAVKMLVVYCKLVYSCGTYYPIG